MDNFEEKFLEQLAKARARLEGKEAYDDEAIKKEYDPDLKTSEPTAAASENKPAADTVKESVKKEKAPEKPVQPDEAAAEVKEEPVKTAVQKAEKKSSGSEKPAVIWGGCTVAISLILSCLGIFVNSTSQLWQTIEAYMPFAGILCGASAFIWGSVLIKNNKKGTVPLILGLLAIVISAVLSSF